LLWSLAAVTALPPAAAGATTYNVTSEADVGGTCPPSSCTLRQAVNTVNGGSGGDLIEVPAGHYTLTLGELQLEKDVTIVGAGPATTTIDGNATSRIFGIPGTTVTANVSGLTIENGRVLGMNPTQAHGGGIVNSGTLTLDDVLVRDNEVAPADNTGLIPAGGGIFNSGTLLIVDSAIEGNETTTLPHTGGIPQGAGIANENGKVEMTDSVLSENIANNKSGIPEGAGFSSSASAPHGASVTLTRVLVEGNEALAGSGGGIPDGGGGFAFRTDLTIRESTIRGNRAIGGAIADGGGLDVIREGDFVLERSLVVGNVAESSTFTNGAGIMLSGETTEVHRVVNSTITTNRGTSANGSEGAGIFHFGGVRLDLLSSTISGNIVSGGGVNDRGANLVDGGVEGSLTSVRNSIVSAGVGAAGLENCSGAGVQSAGHNIDSLDQCNFHAAGDKVNTDPLLALPADNGGPTATMAIGSGSPALDAGDAACPPTDQRGVARPQGTACDIGAFEFVPPLPPAKAPPSPVVSSGAALLRFLSGKVSINLENGKGSTQVECKNVAGDVCDVTLRLLAPAPPANATASAKRGSTRIGIAKGTIAGGKTGKLRFKLKRKGIAMLAAKPGLKLRVRASGQSRNRAGQPTPLDRKLKLKGKAAKRGDGR
jgi:hypothetical protein